MKRKVARINGKVFITVSQKCFVKLAFKASSLPYLYISPKDEYIPILNFEVIFSDTDNVFNDEKDLFDYLQKYENECFYYTGKGIEYWVNTEINSYNEYTEIARDYPLSRQQYTTLVKQYCKWAQ